MSLRSYYYLNTQVKVIEPGEEYGWVWCEWPDGKRYLHWHTQLYETPYGRGEGA